MITLTFLITRLCLMFRLIKQNHIIYTKALLRRRFFILQNFVIYVLFIYCMLQLLTVAMLTLPTC
jgi:hypothetical protein